MSLSNDVTDDSSDAVLITAARLGDAAAVTLLYERHHPAALRLATRLSDPVTAEDITSEALTKVFAIIGRGGGPDFAFRPYVLRAVHNAYVSHVRSDSRHTWIADYSTVEEVDDDPAAQREESSVLARAMQSLPERWQIALWHSAVEGESSESIGRLLGIAPGAVPSLTYRAREGLRQAYLAQHLTTTDAAACRATRAELPAYARGQLGARSRAAVEAHLDGCTACTALVDELEALGTRKLGALLVPAVLGLGVKADWFGHGAVPATAVTTAASGGGAAAGAAAGGLPAPLVATAVAVGLAGAATVAIVLVTRGDGATPEARSPEATSSATAPTSARPTPTTSASRSASTPSSEVPRSTPATTPAQSADDSTVEAPPASSPDLPVRDASVTLTGKSQVVSRRDTTTTLNVRVAGATSGQSVLTLDATNLRSYVKDAGSMPASCSRSGTSVRCVVNAASGIVRISLTTRGASTLTGILSTSTTEDPAPANNRFTTTLSSS